MARNTEQRRVGPVAIVGHHVAASFRALGSVARDPDLRRVQLAWSGCITAEWAQMVVLAVVAFRAQGAVGVGIVTVARSVPAAVIGPFAAALADRFRGERVLSVVLVGRAVLFGVVAVLLRAEGPLAVVVAVAAVDAVAYSLFWPAHSSLLPALAQTAQRLAAANVTSTTIRNLGTLVGPLMSGVVLAAAGPAAAMELSVLLLALSAFAMMRVDVSPRVPRGIDDDDGRRLLAGFRTLRRDPGPRLVVLLYCAQLLCLGAVGVIVAVLAIDVHESGEPAVGYLSAAIGAGGMLGAVGSLVLVGRPQIGRAFLVALLLWGAALLATAVAPTAVVVGALLVLLGASNAVVDVAALTLLQRIVEDHLLARVLGVMEGLTWAMLGIGAVLASVLVDVIGPRPTIALVGAVLPALGALTASATGRVDARATIDARVVDLLSGLPMFGGLAPPALERLALAAERVLAPSGSCIIRMGDEGDRFYVIDRGEVEIQYGTGTSRFGQGSHFGEIALLRSVPRTATVTAVTDTELIALGREDFLSVLAGHRAGREAAEAGVAELLA